MITVMAIIMINYTDDDVTDADPDWALTTPRHSKSVKMSTSALFAPKNSTKNA